MRATLVLTAKIFLSSAILSVAIIVLISENIWFVRNRVKTAGLKYILVYTSPHDVPAIYLEQGRIRFIKDNCPYKNCIVKSNRNYLGDLTMFDVVVFAGPEVLLMPKNALPKQRSPHQKYVFACIESSNYYPACSNRLDGFFNWTWTFRLDSAVRWGYMDVRDANDKIVGPNKEMHWMKVQDMEPISEELKQKLEKKTKAAAWFVSNCDTNSNRFEFATVLGWKLKKYGLEIDMYGDCGPLKCPKEEHEKCMKMVDEKYFFYLSFENAFSEDYVTEKLLQALKVDVIPVVFGGANYTRFMPDGIYLNARELGVEKLAAKMSELINDPEEYANYFRWKKYYSYHHKHERPETNEYCKMCELLNDEEQMKKTTVVQNFRDWWDSPKFC